MGVAKFFKHIWRTNIVHSDVCALIALLQLSAQGSLDFVHTLGGKDARKRECAKEGKASFFQQVLDLNAKALQT